MSTVKLEVILPAFEGSKQVGHTRRVFELADLTGRTTVAANFNSYYGRRDIHHSEGAFYVRLSDHLNQPAGELLNQLFRRHHSLAATDPRGVLRDCDIATLAERYAVYDDFLVEKIPEPVWRVSVEDTGGRMGRRENARQGICINLTAQLDHGPRFSVAPLSAAAAPAVIFNLNRHAEAVALVAPLAAAIPYGSRSVVRDNCEIHHPELFAQDDVAGTFQMIGPMLVNLGHCVIDTLSRRGVENWLVLRGQVGPAAATPPSQSKRLNEIRETAARLLADLREARSSGAETNTQLKRARNCATLLVHRLDCDLDPRHQPARQPHDIAVGELCLDAAGNTQLGIVP